MPVFIDTSALLAVLNANDQFHKPARDVWIRIIEEDQLLISTNYILLETITILQHRFGMDAVRLFQTGVYPMLRIEWIGEEVHDKGISALFAANRKELSLVDCTSFEVMRQIGVQSVFTFDHHFKEQGFSVIPEC